jgi:hypothetical protein
MNLGNAMNLGRRSALWWGTLAYVSVAALYLVLYTSAALAGRDLSVAAFAADMLLQPTGAGLLVWGGLALVRWFRRVGEVVGREGR